MYPTVSHLCNTDEINNFSTDEDTQNQIELKPEDEISLDSILSTLMKQIEPLEAQYKHLKWELTAKDFYNEKHTLIFDEKLYISRLTVNECKFKDEIKMFVEDELDEIGSFQLRVKETYGGFGVLAKSQIFKNNRKPSSGHCLQGKYDENFKLIFEKRSEFNFMDNSRIERMLDVRRLNDKLIARRKTKINKERQYCKAVINMKDRDNAIVLDGGVMLLMRHLVLNNFRGIYNYYTMNLSGQILHCQLKVHDERKTLQIFHRTFSNATYIVNTQYFNNVIQEITETFYNASAKIILHFWHGYRYVLHETKGCIESTERVVPILELMWRSHNQLLQQYRLEKKLNYTNAMAYFKQHSELAAFLTDFVLNVLKYKPQNVLEFTVKLFQKFRKPSLGS